jgi:hypothetical protein
MLARFRAPLLLLGGGPAVSGVAGAWAETARVPAREVSGFLGSEEDLDLDIQDRFAKSAKDLSAGRGVSTGFPAGGVF